MRRKHYVVEIPMAEFREMQLPWREGDTASGIGSDGETVRFWKFANKVWIVDGDWNKKGSENRIKRADIVVHVRAPRGGFYNGN